MLADAQKKFNNPSFFITASSLQTDIEEMLGGFIDVIGNDIKAFGGMAGDDLTFTTQYVFTANQESDRAVITLVFDQDKVLMKGSATHGWKAVGTEKTVTKSSGSQLFEIENTPALDVCLKYSGLKADMPNLPMELANELSFTIAKTQWRNINASLIPGESGRPFYDNQW
ncbi:MAG: FIST N-terminal domain-containing protein [Chitinophagaceae bacterium]